MNKNYLLTVIVPVYNTAKYVERCINSILNQSLKEIQVIIIDDASSDSSYEMICRFKQFDNVRIIRNSENIGQGATRNLGLEYVDTKYFCFLDSDDWVDTNTYEQAVSTLEKKNDCTIAVFGIKTEYDNACLSEIRYSYHNNTISSDFAISLLTRECAQDAPISALLGNKVFRSDHHLGSKFTDRFFEDAIYMYKTFLCAENVLLLSNGNLHYYQRPDSIMHTFSKRYIDDLCDEFIDLRSYLLHKGTPINLNQYYSYFEKCCNSMLRILFSTTQDVSTQKQNLAHFFNRIFQSFSVNELVDYIDISRIKKIFLL